MSETDCPKHPAFIVRDVPGSDDPPFNGGSSLDNLIDHAITPADHFFVRNHGAVPRIDTAAYRLIIDGLVTRPLALSLDDLRAFPRHEIVAVMQCAGNRRRELETVAPIPDEIIWDTEAISNGRWGGVRLRDVLMAAGAPTSMALHVAFEGADSSEKAPRFGGSIPLAKALDPDTLLADMLNGEPLPAAHGCPLRAVIPGYIGARSVKWLARITVQPQPSDNYYQAHAYKLFPPEATPETVDWSQGEMLGELNLSSLIAQPNDGDTVRNGDFVVRGFAIAPRGDALERVEVGVQTAEGWRWQAATFIDAPTAWGWRRWSASLVLPPGEHIIAARAWDVHGATQPEHAATTWNFKGYMNNAYHRITVRVVS